MGGRDAINTNTEHTVAAVWSSVLNRDEIARDDDFFESGGNSMTATLAIYRLRDEFGLELPLMLIFENSTVGELACAIDELRRGDGPDNA